MKILQDLYNSEINFGIDTFYDGGCNVQLGDTTNGVDGVTNTKTVSEAIQWLKQQAIVHYPDSAFAKKYKDNGVVQQLRDAGYRVDITHSRYHPKHFNHSPDGDTPILMEIHRLRKLYNKLNEVNPRGGQTVVFITHLESGVTYNGKALCSMSDTFNRKLGIKIAIARALDGKSNSI